MIDGLRIRPAEVADAEALIAYMHRLTNEPHNNITLDPGQWTMTVEQEREFIAKRGDSTEEGIFVVAQIAGELVGVANLNRYNKPTIRHVAMLGVSVDAKWRGKGIGAALMAYLLNWAKANGLVRVELKVFSRNTVAIRLYERFGFKIEGRHPHAALKQGQWREDFTMGLTFPENLGLTAGGTAS
jgi:RimJ/RimL family protein N-acetyltransferase